MTSTDTTTTESDKERRERQVHGIARIGLAFVWIWHGLVPKLLTRDPVEVDPLLRLGLSESDSWTIVAVAGWGEILFGLVILLFWRARWPLVLTIFVMTGLLFGVIGTEPRLLGGAFNPVTLNLLVIGMAVIALMTSRHDELKEGNIMGSN